MTGAYQLVSILSPGLRVIRRQRAERLWALARVRKQHRCAGCSGKLEPGAMAWSPVDQSCAFRYERLCGTCGGGDGDGGPAAA